MGPRLRGDDGVFPARRRRAQLKHVLRLVRENDSHQSFIDKPLPKQEHVNA
jgi:hypothetical protein